jgi:16S rRNA processing protein RimM
MSRKRTQIQKTQASSSGSPMPGEPEFLAVGKLRRPHGVRGEMLMTVWTDFPERLQPGRQVFVGESYQSLCIKNMRGHEQNSLISFDEYDSREDVGRLRNQVVFVRTSDLPPLPDDEFYLHQLLGLRVVQDKDDILLGMVAEIIETGANHVFLVRRDGKSDILIPDVDLVVLNIDLNKREIRVHLLPGLIPDDQL